MRSSAERSICIAGIAIAKGNINAIKTTQNQFLPPLNLIQNSPFDIRFASSTKLVTDIAHFASKSVIDSGLTECDGGQFEECDKPWSWPANSSFTRFSPRLKAKGVPEVPLC